IARALAHEPDVLIADEATGMIDPDVSDEIVELLEKINSLGTTVIMATHDQRIVDKLTKRVIKIQKGKLVSDKKGGKYRA
ncbi:MAG TPA: cell division ATP-binding protein FtsE, partial [bacterium]|nr:cell division ATP-binding protein FtsE [bacterium]